MQLGAIGDVMLTYFSGLFGKLASILDKEHGDRTERPGLQGDDAVLHGDSGNLTGKTLRSGEL